MRPLDPSETEQAQLHSCWNSIGVAGDKSCPALLTHAHCRNCPTYSDAAMSLLDRARPAASSDTSHYNEQAVADRPKDRSAVIFRLGVEWFAVATAAFDEVVEPRPIHALPHRRNPAILGIANVRGELIVCLSLGRVLGVAEDDARDASKRRRLLVLRSETGRVAIPVDEVQHAQRYHDGELAPPPATVTRSENSFTTGLLVGPARTAGKLDEARLFAAIDRIIA